MAGFTLLEAIVALTILALVMFAAWSWIGNGMRTLERVRDLAPEQAAFDDVLGALERQDLALAASGVVESGSYRVEWRSTPAYPARQGRTSAGGAGRWLLTLYDVDLRAYAGGRLVAAPRVRVLQYVKAPVVVAEPAS